MEVYNNRLSSFTRGVRVNDGLNSNSLLKWPHSSRFIATPQTLAEAGFYFSPSSDTKDSVICFMCSKELGTWDEDDDPFEIHFTKCRATCPWANLRCGLREDLDEDGRYTLQNKTRDPTSKAMEKARVATFKVGSGWEHDRTRNHGASSKKMAQAGFVYTPETEGDDLASCLYCNVALSGWDAEDDPKEEHHKRVIRNGVVCPFFPDNTTSKPTKSSKSRHKDIVMPMKTHDGADDDIDPKSTAKTPRKPRATKGAKTPKTRSSSRAPVIAEEESNEGEDMVPLSKTLKKSKRSRKKSLSQSDSDENDDEVPPPAKSSKTRAKAASSVDSNKVALKVPSKSTRSRTKSVAPLPPSDTDNDAGEAAAAGKPAPKSRLKTKADAAAVNVDALSANNRRTRSNSTVGREPVSKATSQKPLPRSSSRNTATHGNDGEILTRSSSKPPSKKAKSKAVEVSDEESTIARPPSRAASHMSKSSRAPSPVLELDEEDMYSNNYIPPLSSPPSPPIVKHSKSKAPRATSSKPHSVADSHRPVSSKVPWPDQTVDQPPPREKPAKNSKSHPFAEIHKEPEYADIHLPTEILSDKSHAEQVRRRTHSGGESNRVPLTIHDHNGKAPVGSLTQAVSAIGERELNSTASKVSQSSKIVHRGDGSDDDRTEVELQVVDISTDEEDDKMDWTTQSPSQTKPLKQKKTRDMQSATTLQPLNNNTLASNPGTTLPLPSSHTDSDKSPFDYTYPTTPPHHAGKPLPDVPKMENSGKENVADDVGLEPQFFSSLSQEPFTDIHTLSDAELDMTVEEWIHYQINLEYAKFKKDGERELERFLEQAEQTKRRVKAL